MTGHMFRDTSIIPPLRMHAHRNILLIYALPMLHAAMANSLDENLRLRVYVKVQRMRCSGFPRIFSSNLTLLICSNNGVFMGCLRGMLILWLGGSLSRPQDAGHRIVETHGPAG